MTQEAYLFHTEDRFTKLIEAPESISLFQISTIGIYNDLLAAPNVLECR